MKFKFIFLILSIFVFDRLFSGIDPTKRTLRVFFGSADNKVTTRIRVYLTEDPSKFVDVYNDKNTDVIFNISTTDDVPVSFCTIDKGKNSCNGPKHSFSLPKMKNSSDPKDCYIVITVDGRVSNPI